MTYYAFWAVPVVAAAAWARSRCRAVAVRDSAPSERAAGAGLLAMAVLANMSFLRANLAERFGDAAVPVVLLAAWTVGTAAAWTSPAARAAVALIPALLLVQMFAAAYDFSDVRRELDTSGLSDSWGKITRRYAAVRDELRGLPPATWQADAERVRHPRRRRLRRPVHQPRRSSARDRRDARDPGARAAAVRGRAGHVQALVVHVRARPAAGARAPRAAIGAARARGCARVRRRLPVRLSAGRPASCRALP